jgi:hypothetical protein
MPETFMKAIALVTQGFTTAEAAAQTGVEAAAIVQAIAEQDRKRNNHQTR